MREAEEVAGQPSMQSQQSAAVPMVLLVWVLLVVPCCAMHCQIASELSHVNAEYTIECIFLNRARIQFGRIPMIPVQGRTKCEINIGAQDFKLQEQCNANVR
jgi:hypothetical protein